MPSGRSMSDRAGLPVLRLSYKTSDDDEQGPKHLLKCMKQLQVQKKSQQLDLKDALSLIGFLKASKMAYNNMAVQKGSVIWLAPHFQSRRQGQH